jgi:GT2 family glycosyltransferase
MIRRHRPLALALAVRILRMYDHIRHPDAPGVSAISGPDHRIFAIDSPTTWTLADRCARMSGWAFIGSAGIEAMRVRFPGVLPRVYDSEYGLPRPDVLKNHPGMGTDRVGFRIDVPLPRGRSRFFLEVLHQGHWLPLCRISASTPYAQSLQPPATLAYSYADHLAHDVLVTADLAAATVADARALPHRPSFSLVMPVYNPPIAALRAAIASVRAQSWPDWQLVMVDDCSRDAEVKALLASSAIDPRIKVITRSANGGISRATNDGLAAATGDWIALLDHDDALAPHALALFARATLGDAEADILYSDQDKIDSADRHFEPFLKPDWSPAFFCGVMYLGHLLAFRRALLEPGGGCDPRFDGVQDFELALRLSERARRVLHIPHILYHWRVVPGSIAGDGKAKPHIEERQILAVDEHFRRLGIPARADASNFPQRLAIRPKVPAEAATAQPLISLMIPTRDRPELIGMCLKSIFESSTYRNFEVIVGDNESVDPEALATLKRYPVRTVPLAGKFHFSRFNNLMARHARGDYLVLLNNDTEVVSGDWMENLLLYARQTDVGAVGALLLYEDRTVQHSGVVIGPRGTADHVMRGFPLTVDGHFGSLACTREVSAVTGACLMTRATTYAALGGLCERFQRHYEDVDFCLRLREQKLRNIVVANAILIHHESKTRGPQYNVTDRFLLRDRWGQIIDAGDQYHSRHYERIAAGR